MVDDEEKLQLRADVERYKKIIRQKDEMIEEMEQELTRGPTPISHDEPRAREKELNGQLLDLQMDIESKNSTITKKESLIEELRDEIDKLEKSNRELANRSICPESDDSSSFLESEMIRITEELEKYKEMATKLLEKNLEYEKDFLQMKSDYESAMDHVSSLESHLKTREEEISRLEGEIFDMKCSGQGKFASVGNSIFAEAMDAERKLEEDLKRVFFEKKYLSDRVKRLESEKEDAEERARTAMERGNAVRTAIRDVDSSEMQRLRGRVQELEAERIHLWERFFLKLRGLSKRELGGFLSGYIESFKLSIASVSRGHEEMAKKNEHIIATLRGSQKDNEDLRAKIEQLEFDVETLRRYKERTEVNFANVDVSLSDSHKLLAPLKSLKPPNKERMTFFKKQNYEDRPVDVEISLLSMTPQKPLDVSCSIGTEKKENTSAWVEQRQRVKEERKQASATPFKSFNFVPLSVPSTAPKFKPGTLQMPANEK